MQEWGQRKGKGKGERNFFPAHFVFVSSFAARFSPWDVNVFNFFSEISDFFFILN